MKMTFDRLKLLSENNQCIHIPVKRKSIYILQDGSIYLVDQYLFVEKLDIAEANEILNRLN